MNFSFLLPRPFKKPQSRPPVPQRSVAPGTQPAIKQQGFSPKTKETFNWADHLAGQDRRDAQVELMEKHIKGGRVTDRGSYIDVMFSGYASQQDISAFKAQFGKALEDGTPLSFSMSGGG